MGGERRRRIVHVPRPDRMSGSTVTHPKTSQYPSPQSSLTPNSRALTPACARVGRDRRNPSLKSDACLPRYGLTILAPISPATMPMRKAVQRPQRWRARVRQASKPILNQSLHPSVVDVPPWGSDPVGTPPLGGGEVSGTSAVRRRHVSGRSAENAVFRSAD